MRENFPFFHTVETVQQHDFFAEISLKILFREISAFAKFTSLLELQNFTTYVQCFKTSRANFPSKFQNRLALNWLDQIANMNYLTFYTLFSFVLGVYIDVREIIALNKI